MSKMYFLFAISLFMICIATDVAAQASRESEIRQLEDLERRAVMATDSTALFNKFWSPNMMARRLSSASAI